MERINQNVEQITGKRMVLTCPLMMPLKEKLTWFKARVTPSSNAMWIPLIGREKEPRQSTFDQNIPNQTKNPCSWKDPLALFATWIYIGI
jgi:hypothetical protein